MNKNSAIGSSWGEVRAELFTPEEIAESNLRVALIGELINARQEKGITQKELEKMSGVKQPVIARMETGSTSPQLDTILKILAPLGKTLAVLFLLPESEYRRRASPKYRGRFFMPRRYIASIGKIYTLDIFTRLLGRTLSPPKSN